MVRQPSREHVTEGVQLLINAAGLQMECSCGCVDVVMADRREFNDHVARFLLEHPALCRQTGESPGADVAAGREPRK